MEYGENNAVFITVETKNNQKFTVERFNSMLEESLAIHSYQRKNIPIKSVDDLIAFFGSCDERFEEDEGAFKILRNINDIREMVSVKIECCSYCDEECDLEMLKEDYEVVEEDDGMYIGVNTFIFNYKDGYLVWN